MTICRNISYISTCFKDMSIASPCQEYMSIFFNYLDMFSKRVHYVDISKKHVEIPWLSRCDLEIAPGTGSYPGTYHGQVSLEWKVQNLGRLAIPREGTKGYWQLNWPYLIIRP